MSNRGTGNASLFLLQLAVALFFLSAGIVGIVNYNSGVGELQRVFGQLFGSNNSNLNLVIAVLELIAGGILVIGCFVSFSGNSGFIAAISIFVLWAVHIVYTSVVNNFLEPDLLVWLYRVSPDLIVLASLWTVARRYS